jgi:hypothetical protein
MASLHVPVNRAASNRFTTNQILYIFIDNQSVTAFALLRHGNLTAASGCFPPETLIQLAEYTKDGLISVIQTMTAAVGEPCLVWPVDG